MAGQDEFFLNQGKHKEEEEAMYLNQYTKNWGERLTFTAGMGFLFGLGAGGFAGGVIGIRKARKSKYAKVAHFRWKTSTMMLRGANGFAAASVLFVFVTKTIELTMEEEIEDLGPAWRHIISGAVTGTIYKSTLGRRPMVVGGILGGVIAYYVSNMINTLYQRGTIGFKAEF